MLLATLLTLLAAIAHPNSISSSELVSSPGGGFHVTLAFEARTVAEFHTLDLDGDGALTPAELATQADFFEAYFARHFRLALGSREERATGLFATELTHLAIDDLLGAAPAPPGGLPVDEAWLTVELELTPPKDAPAAATTHVWLEVDPFAVTSPDHRHFARLERSAGPADWTFSAANPLWVVPFDARAAEASPDEGALRGLGAWLRLGVDHILGGWDHLAFLFALVLATRTLRSLAATVTAFTLAHSITLGLAATGHVPAGGRWVEAVIAASIAFVGLHNIVRPEARSTWKEAAGFGLVHGLGFAGYLTETLAHAGRAGESPVVPLLGFNLGVEAGQLLMACAFAVGLALLERSRPAVPQERWTRLGSWPVVAIGLYWTFERVFG